MDTNQPKIFTQWTFGKSAFTGLFLWSMLFFMVMPEAKSEAWTRLMLGLAAMVWLPLALKVIFQTGGQEAKYIFAEKILRHSILPAASLFAIALFLPGSPAGIILALPWFIVTCLVFKYGLGQLAQKPCDRPGDLAIIAACLYLPVGSLWAVADRLDIQPLGFDPAIVLLTAVHFHYAGFLFLAITGLGMRKYPSLLLKLACYLAIAAVPLTALGITFAQLWGNFLLEVMAAGAVVLAGWCCSIAYLKLVLEGKVKGLTATLWTIMPVSLLLSMTLAFFYAIRPWYPMEWLNIPWMRAWHGTANALGVAGCGVLGWWFLSKKNL